MWSPLWRPENKATEELIRRIVHMATIASASTPAVQSFCCLLRNCSSQKVGRLLRIIPPAQASNLATHLDQCVASATCALVGVEDIPHFEKELLTFPANSGGWSLPALGLFKGCAYIAGAAATPRIQSWEAPANYSQNIVDCRTREVEKAILNVSETLGYNLCEETNLSPEEYARGGFEERKHKTDQAGQSQANPTDEGGHGGRLEKMAGRREHG